MPSTQRHYFYSATIHIRYAQLLQVHLSHLAAMWFAPAVHRAHVVCACKLGVLGKSSETGQHACTKAVIEAQSIRPRSQRVSRHYLRRQPRRHFTFLCLLSTETHARASIGSSFHRLCQQNFLHRTEALQIRPALCEQPVAGSSDDLYCS